MTTRRFTFALLLACVVAPFLVSSASAQMTKERAKAISTRLHQLQATAKKIPAAGQLALSGNSHLLQIAKVWDNLAAQMIKNPATRPSLSGFTPNSLGGIVPVSNPATDLDFSSFAGFTQSETSTARCGNNVVVGFNDSGSVFETGFFSGGGESFSGAAFSTNGGTSFTDVGPIPPGAPVSNFLGGDPVVNCSDSSTFYYSQIFVTADSSGNPLAAIAVSKSTDGGANWEDPVAAVSKDGIAHLLDKDWSTIDPKNTKRIYVSYTDFDFSGSSAACGANIRTAIEFVESDDGGRTWGKPHVAIEVCGNAAVQGSQLAVDSHGTLHIAWVNLGANFPFSIRQIQASSFVPGRSLSAPVTVEGSLVPGGDSFYLQGEFRDFLSMAMAVDRSGTSSDGNLYIAWADGRDKIIPDPVGIDGAYAFDDLLLRQSFDGGATWGSSPTKVNTDIQPRLGLGHDHYQPGIAVDRTGKVAACWYDRRADAENFAIGRWCGESTTNGFSWSNANTGLSPFAPTHGTDIFINPVYMGDYDQLTSDFTGAHAGFIGAFQSMGNRGNPDVVAFSFQ